MLLLFPLLHLLLSAVCVSGNADKIIFVAPDALDLPTQVPTLAQLRLPSITPAEPVLRSFSPVVHPNESHPRGLSSWYLLESLEPNARYELRICWSATQPTKWDIETYTIRETLETPELIQDLGRFAEQRNVYDGGLAEQSLKRAQHGPQSLLFLRTWAAADFYSLDRDLMLHPPPVHAELILDHYVLDAFPRSLLPTAVYIICVALIGWSVTNRVWTWLETLLSNEKSHAE